MVEDNPRKASDILLMLEAKVETLSKHIENVDNNIKLILNRLAANNAIKQGVYSKEEVISDKNDKIADTMNNIVLEQNKSAKKVEEEKDYDFPQVEDDLLPKASGRKVAVQQRITYSDGKNICLANVEIKNSVGQSIKKMRTNAMGKWIAVLEPGNYMVNILKSANKTNPDVDLNFPISIPESDRPIELPIPKI